MVRNYELMLVLRPDTVVKDEKKYHEMIKKLLSDHKYTVKETVALGKKNLAYPIDNLKEGYYVLCKLEADSIQVGSVEAKARLENSVIRFLLTKTEN